MVVAWVLVAIASAIAGAGIGVGKVAAAERDGDGFWAGFGGLLLGGLAGPVGVIILLLIPPTAGREAERRLAIEDAERELRAGRPRSPNPDH